MDDFKLMAGEYNPYYEEPHTDEPQWFFVMRNGLCREVDRLTAELAEAKERERVLRAFVAAFDAWREGGLWPDADVSKILRADLHAAREAVGPCS